MQLKLERKKYPAALVLSLFLLPAVTQAQHYKQTNLVSDLSNQGAAVVDPNLRNPWGLTRAAPAPANPNGSPWWIGNNNSGTSTLYDGGGNPQNFFPDPHPDSNGNGINSPFNNFVMVPPPGFAPGTQSAPTGVVFNGSKTDFLLVPGKPGTQAIFIFATEDGTISGWNPGANPPSSITNAILKVDNSDKGSANSAVYKGMTSADVAGNKFLYVTNFRSAKVEVYDTNFRRVFLRDDAFVADEIRLVLRRSIFKTLAGLSSSLMPSRMPPGMTPSAVPAWDLSSCFLRQASISATSSTEIGSTPPGVSCGPRATSVSSAIPFSSAIFAVVGSPHSTASPTNSSASSRIQTTRS